MTKAQVVTISALELPKELWSLAHGLVVLLVDRE